jgi:hypothetical protein
MWWQLSCTGDIPEPRSRATACVIDDIMFLFGGRSPTSAEQYSNELFAFDIPGTCLFRFFLTAARRWTYVNDRLTGFKPAGRCSHGMAAHRNAIFVFGGCDANGSLDDENRLFRLNTADLFTSRYLRGRRPTLTIQPCKSSGDLISPTETTDGVTQMLTASPESLTPPYSRTSENPSRLIRFLGQDCKASRLRYKYDSKCESTDETHWTAGKKESLACQRRIDSGSSADVFQVHILMYQRC